MPGTITDIKTAANSRALSATFSTYLGKYIINSNLPANDSFHDSAFNDSSFHFLYNAADGNATWLAGLKYSDTGELEWIDLGIDGFRPHDHISGRLSSSMSLQTTFHYSIEATVCNAADAEADLVSFYNGTIEHESMFPALL